MMIHCTHLIGPFGVNKCFRLSARRVGSFVKSSLWIVGAVFECAKGGNRPLPTCVSDVVRSIPFEARNRDVGSEGTARSTPSTATRKKELASSHRPSAAV